MLTRRTTPASATITAALSLALVLASPVAVGVQATHLTRAVPTSRAVPVPMPAHPTGLPAPGPLGRQVDPASGYQPQLSCVSTASRGIVALRALVLSTYGRGGASPATPRACVSGGTSEHKDGRAWDWMVPVAVHADRRAAADFLSWLTGPGPSGTQGEMANRLGVMYLIYNKMMWSSYDRHWHPYTGADPHTSHLHISLSWNGARADTSFWTGHVWPMDYGTCQPFAGEPGISPGPGARLTACPDPQPLVRSSPEPLGWLGSAGSSVTKGQRLLGISASGSFGTATRTRVLAYQRANDLPATGALDQPTWSRLVPTTSILRQPAWSPHGAATWARRAGSPVVRLHDAGADVFALQAALRIPPRQRTGYYGRVTRAAVAEVKQAHDLSTSALVTAEVWAVLPTPLT